MKILITGGTGFIGRRTATALMASGDYSVTFTGRNVARASGLIAKGARFLPGDLTDPNYNKEITRDIDAIVHCAGLAGTWGTYETYYKANVLATRLLLENARANGVRRIVNISSPSIYFAYKHQYNLKEENIPAKFSNFYAQTKFSAEALISSFHAPDFQTVSLRPRSVIGAGDQNVLPRLIRLQKSGNLVQVGNGRNIVDITTVGNLIDAILLCLHAPESAMGGVYNITNGSPVRLWDFVDEVLKTAGLPLKRKKLPYRIAIGAALVNEIVCKALRKKSEPVLLPISVGTITFSMTLNIDKARERLGYTPRLTTSDGINEFFK